MEADRMWANVLEFNHPTSRFNLNHAGLRRDGRVGTGAGYENTMFSVAFIPQNVALLVRAVCHGIEKFLHIGHQWVSRFQLPLLLIRRWMSTEWSGCPGSKCDRQADSSIVQDGSIPSQFAVRR